MSCMIAALPGGSPEIFPLPVKSFMELGDNGMRAAQSLGLKKKQLEPEQFIGATTRTDGTPFYLWSTAPTLKAGTEKDWTGTFFAPFGVGNLYGRVDASPGQLDDKKDEFAITTLKVNARLAIQGKDVVVARWTVIGSQLTVPNKMAMIKSVKVEKKGPHNAEDIRKCIALHAPQRALGEPRAIVAMQCGVAAACLVEAIC